MTPQITRMSEQEAEGLLQHAYRTYAIRHLSRDGAVEVDPGAPVSLGRSDTPGAYVQAWIWIDAADLAREAKR